MELVMNPREMRIICKALRALSFPERRRVENLTLAPDSFMQTVLKDNPDSAICWLAESEERILGWSLIRWFPQDVFGRTGSYISVFVDKAHRGHGLGKLLVREAISYAREHEMRPWFYGARQENKSTSTRPVKFHRCPSRLIRSSAGRPEKQE
jgi:GNAT superfamily N-acetyltransferase